MSFWLLGCSLGCWRVTPEEELHFRWLCFLHSGIVDEQKTFNFLRRIRNASAISENLQKRAGKRRKIFNEINEHPIFNLLNKDTQSAIQNYGAWRIGPKGEMSWADLARFSPLHSAMGQYEYFNMGQYSHPSHRGVAMDGMHDSRNINNDLASLYVITAMFIHDMDRSFPGSDEKFTIKELAIITELREIATEWCKLPPLRERE
ncbi:MAG: hypothetical protein KGH75_05280 [Rhodospirillales bacterium]|nr:hypothetical protein [Rhodospirillales bacterium]